MRIRKTTGVPFFVGLMIAFCFSVISASSAIAQDWKFHSIVDVNFVQQYVKIPAPKDVFIIDSRPTKLKYDKGYIPNAINIPDSSFDKFKHLLPENKDALLIFYCQGPSWKMSHKSAWKAEKLGYTNVKNFNGGYPAWLKVPGNYGGVTAAHIKNELGKEHKLFIVDSRPRKTGYNKGHVTTAISLPDSKFDALNGLLPRDKDIPLVFYCGGFTWKMSHKSASKAGQLGYKNITVFAAGYPAWVKLVGKSEAIEIKAGEEEGSVDIKLFRKIITESPDSIMLIDVRDPDEFAAGHFPTAVNIPTDKLEVKLKTMKADKPIFFVCATGARSGEAFYMVQDMRPDIKEVYYVEAEITYSADGYDIKKGH